MEIIEKKIFEIVGIDGEFNSKKSAELYIKEFESKKILTESLKIHDYTDEQILTIIESVEAMPGEFKDFIEKYLETE